MQSCIKNIPDVGQVLWLEDGRTEVGVALDFGIRVVHVSCVGCDNLFYQQPADLSDGFVTDSGWRLRGGHRIWMAPECDDTYCPDNAPVSYELFDNAALIVQDPEPWLGIRKSLRIIFQDDGGITLEQSIENVTDHPIDGASWGVNTLDGGGKAFISFTNNDQRGYTPHRVVSLWSDTNLHDPRLSFDKDGLTAQHMPLPNYLKLGLYCIEGKAVLENKGQKMTICFDSAPLNQYPDNGCNFELYMCSKFMELETIGVKAHILPGQNTSHKETWYLTKV